MNDLRGFPSVRKLANSQRRVRRFAGRALHRYLLHRTAEFALCVADRESLFSSATRIPNPPSFVFQRLGRRREILNSVTFPRLGRLKDDAMLGPGRRRARLGPASICGRRVLRHHFRYKGHAGSGKQRARHKRSATKMFHDLIFFHGSCPRHPSAGSSTLESTQLRPAKE
ncbi:MAG: hypothetical protein ACYTA5_09840 [Planctomycetota bacterium]